MNICTSSSDQPIFLVTGGSGKTGARVARRLRQRGVHTRAVSRGSQPAFDWNAPEHWQTALDGVHAVYLSFAPDLAVPGAPAIIGAFVEAAVAQGVERIVLLSGRGESEAEACEQIVRASGIDWTIVRASWFMQNFSEGEFRDMVLAGDIALPAADVAEPFVDVDDIADVAVAALTEPGHAGQLYDVTGPRLLTLADAAAEISAATGRQVRFTRVSRTAFAQALAEAGAPDEFARLLDYLMVTVLDGRNAFLGDGVQRALGRAPNDFQVFARDAARAWRTGEREQAA